MLGNLTLYLLGGVCCGGFANPGTLAVGFAAALHALRVDWAVALDYCHELIPVQILVDPLLGLFVVPQFGIRQGQSEDLTCSAIMPTKRWRSSSLEKRLMFQAMDCLEFGDCSSGGPNIISAGS